MEFLDQGLFTEAQEHFQMVLRIQADHPVANYALGLLALQNGTPRESLAYLEAALDKNPGNGEYWLTYIEALRQAGRVDDAREIMRLARESGLEGKEADELSASLEMDPDLHMETPASLPQASVAASQAGPSSDDIALLLRLYQQNDFDACEKLARSFLSAFPGHGVSWKILGAVYKMRDRLDEAIAAMRQAVRLLPDDHEALNNLGLTLKCKGSLAESENVLRRAIALKSDFSEAYNNLGVTLLARGRLADSEECFRQAIGLLPGYAEAHCNLGIALKDQRKFAESEESLHQALTLRPSFADAYNNLGNVLNAQGKLSESETCLRQALELKPDFAIALNNLGNTLHGQGRMQESEDCYLRALSHAPDYSEAYDGLLFVSNYDPDMTDREVFELYKKYDETFGHPQRVNQPVHSNLRDVQRRLRIGYVSPSFYHHPVMNFLEPLLAHHDRGKFELYGFSELCTEDQITARYKQYFDHWITTIGLSDDELAAHICELQIDILVDLAGHTGRNRLGVFARKPAPVSLHWLDFGYTTGLSAIDYYLTDVHVSPIGSEDLFSESLWRLPVPPFTYRPTPNMGESGPLPALQRGHVTFGTLTRAIRINRRTLHAWSEILKKVSNSRLVVDSGNFKDPHIQKQLIDRFAEYGISPERLEIGYHSPPWNTLRSIDIGLDCFPHNSGTTLFESLYLGVPFVTLADRPGVGRLGSSILHGLGRPEWVARSEQEYIDLAATLASNLPELASIRSKLREQMHHSPLMDEPGFAHAVEDAFTMMFQKWCSLPDASGTSSAHQTHTGEPSAAAIERFNAAVDFQTQENRPEAISGYLSAINLHPGFHQAYNNLGVIAQQEERFADAEAAFFKAMEILPLYTDAHYNLANTYKLQNRYIDAETCYRKVLELSPDFTDAFYNLGNMLQEQGRPQEAETYLRHAISLNPAHIKAFSTLLFALNYHPDKNQNEIYETYREFNSRFCTFPLGNRPFENARSVGRRLKIGYVAPDYRKHPARYFLEPLIANHNKASFEIHAYVEATEQHAATDLFFPYADHWVSAKGLTDEQLSEKIRNDRIDILVDLAGHTSGNRLLVFARKPAPVSLHWLDFGYTTGLTAIDYYLTDEETVPEGAERYFSEKPWRIETPALAYRPPANTGEPGPLPAAANGFVTFGTLTRAVRINHRTIRAWSEILRNVPQSRLIVDSGSFADPKMRERLSGQFQAHGIEGDRLEIGSHSPPWNVLRRIDICLDCFPHNSGTTLIESLYMGVPYIALADRPSVGRLGGAILVGAGHPEWRAGSESEYVALAARLAANLEHLSEIRAGLRAEMGKSPLMDEKGFARKVETAYHEMFALWCAKTHPDTVSGDRSDDRPNRGGLAGNNPQKGSKSKQKKSKNKIPSASDIGRLADLFNSRRHSEALSLALSLTKQFPDHGFGWKVLGPLLHGQGHVDQAIEAMQKAAALLPDDAETLCNLGVALQNNGRDADAEKAYRQVLRLDGSHFQAQFNLGNILTRQGRFSEAEKCFGSVLRSRPDSFEAAGNLGNVLKAQHKLAEAADCYRTALKRKPDSADLYNNLALVTAEIGSYQEAEAYCRKALELNPDFPEPYNNLGLIFQKQGLLKDAEMYFRKSLAIAGNFANALNNLGLNLQQQGRLAESEACYDQALKNSPNFSEAYRNRGILLHKMGRLKDSENSYRQALEINPNDPKTLNNLAVILFKQGQNAEAEIVCNKAIAMDARYPTAHDTLCNIQIKRGRRSEAERHIRRAIELDPHNPKHYDNLLFLLNYDPDRTGEEIFSEYVEYNARFAPPPAVWLPDEHRERRQRKRLRVGYVAPHFRRHSTRHFLEPLLAHHDRERFEIFAYADIFNEDEQTARYKALVDHWVAITGMRHVDVADKIREDRIDILVDLAGHTDGNRLGVFALKPAPVSLHWLDFGYTTGLAAIDYYLTDRATVPEGSENLFSEAPWRIRTPCLSYRPAENMGETGPLPSASNGFITFGTLTRAIRINHRTIRVWSEILRRVEGSRLVVDSGDFSDPEDRQTLLGRFAEHGIGSDRLGIGFHSPPWDVIRGMDIGLDCFPHNSGTTLIESLYLGVPFITLAGRPSIGTLGSAILEGVGHPELIARSEQEYIEKAVALASDRQRLQAIRTGLRGGMRESPLMDEPGFTREVETAFEGMFARWLEGGTADAGSSEKPLPSLLQEAGRLYLDNEYSQAETLYSSIIAKSPKDPEANFGLGRTLVSLQRPKAALPYLETAVDLRPEQGRYWLLLIDALDRSGQSETARELLAMAMKAGLEGEDAEALKSRLQQGQVQASAHDVDRLIALFQQNRNNECEQLALSLLKASPDNALLWKALGLVLKRQARPEEAVPALQKAIGIDSTDWEVYAEIGDIQSTLGNFQSAEDNFRQALALHPESAEMHFALANSLFALGRPAEAVDEYQAALRIRPDFAEAQGNLGNALHRMNRKDEAETCFRRALQINPDYVDARYNLANLLRDMLRLDESRLHYEQALQRKPEAVAILCNLGVVLQMQEDLGAAEDVYRRAIASNPEYVEAYNNLGACLKEQGRYAEAASCYQASIALRPGFALGYSNLGSVLKEQGKNREAEQHLRRAVELQSDRAEIYSNLLFLLNYDPDRTAEEIFDDYRIFNTRYALPLLPEQPSYDNDRDVSRRLKVGYVSPQFRRHSMRHFLEPLLAGHDRQSFEIFAYAHLAQEDEMTARYKAYVDHWVPIRDLTDAELAERIHRDRIDILVDLSGHTANHRLLAFARKPAPVSLHWLDFGYTTGLTAIDYYLTDNISVPQGSEHLFSETPWRLPPPSFVYRPEKGMGEVSPLPATRKGAITFGTLTRAVRLNRRTVRVWSTILQQVPDSRLVIDSSNFRTPEMRREIEEKFFACGIDPSRLEIGFHSPPWDVLRSMDIGLDCFPHNSGTTLVESLYMGVPYTTLADRAGVGRLGASILHAVGHPEWIAETEDDYVQRAVALASDLTKLAAIRTGLRKRMASSPLMDERGFVRKVEEAYRGMFARWAAGLSPEAPGELPDTTPTQNSSERNRSRKRKTGKTKKDPADSLSKQAEPPVAETDRLSALYQQGNPAAALKAADSLLNRFPKSILAWKVRGAVLRQQGELEKALAAMKTAASLAPRDYIALRNIAVLLCDAEQYSEAERYCRKALAMDNKYADAYNTLGISLRYQRRLSESAKACEKALKIKPDFPEALVNRGLIFNELKRFSDAKACFEKALSVNSGLAEAWCGLGISFQGLKEIDEAEKACRQALQLKPEYAEGLNALGGILHEQKRYTEAETAYRSALEKRPSSTEARHNLGKTLFESNRHPEAETCFRQVLEADPGNAEAWYNLGNALKAMNNNAEAQSCFEKALHFDPQYTEAYLNWGNTLRDQGLITTAEQAYREALRQDAKFEKAFNNLGNILQEQGRLAEAETVLRTVIEAKPDFADAHGNLLFLLNYHPDRTGEEIFREYRTFDERFCVPFRTKWRPHANDRYSDRRLRIGYVSPQFCKHPVGNFLEPLLANHDKSTVELYAYAELYKEDAVTLRYVSYMDHWIPTQNMTDDEMAERIREDRIDILVDLAGHTGHNRLLAFARKPAPVSVHWLDFGYSTGLSAIDYYLTDEDSVPAGSEGLFSETPWRVATPCLAYRPTEGMGEVNDLPALRQGHVTFGSLSRAVRINYRTISAWAEILKRVEGSHLVINSGNFKDPEMQKRMADQFAGNGIDPARLEIGCTSPPWDIFRGMDIGLDCFPHNSGTTIIESLYMGVPFVTLAGRASVGRLGCSILKGAGYPECIARSEDEYVELAVQLAANLPKLAHIRRELRPAMQKSPLMDESAFTRKVESAYRQMFEKWCKEQS